MPSTYTATTALREVDATPRDSQSVRDQNSGNRCTMLPVDKSLLSATSPTLDTTNDSKLGPLKFDVQFKVMLLGDSGVGKSSIILRFCNDSFSHNFLPTIGIDFKTKLLEIPAKGASSSRVQSSSTGTLRAPSQTVKLIIWDTAGQERFRSITKAYMRGVHGVVLVYNCMDRNSFENVHHWLCCLEEIGTSGPVFLVANKTDLSANKKSRGIVRTEEGQELALEKGIRYFETSAKDDVGIHDVFHQMARELLVSHEARLHRASLSGSSISTVGNSTSTNINPSSGGISLTKRFLDQNSSSATTSNTCCGTS